jgi:hypothetical protein
MTDQFTFRVLATDGKARRGEISMPRGTVRTPAFMPVGTAGTVKAMYLDQVRDLGSDIILGNTYHLMLRPGAERMARLGGLHEFARWPYPILTDSGGFQVMSLAQLRKLTEKGVTFKSHVDGAAYEMTASFRSADGISIGTDVRMAGVKVGAVTGIALNPDTFRADARFTVADGIVLPEDTAAVISSEGLLGGNFVELRPGGSPFNLEPGSEIVDTQGSVSLVTLLLRFVTGEGGGG